MSEWIQAGFYLVTEAVPHPKDQQFLLSRIITVSNYMAEVYPGAWAITWVETPPEELARIRETLQLTESEFADLRSWVDRAFYSSEFGWPNLFLNLSSARDFNRQFLKAVRGVRLIGLSIRPDDAEELMRLESEWYESGRIRPIGGSPREAPASARSLLPTQIMDNKRTGYQKTAP